jgi:antitoxin component YwqK of YwqJK toxin-antitoxin module
MYRKLVIIASFLAVSITAECQTAATLNYTDPNGLKQGHWIKTYPNKIVMYDGVFKDNHPVGEFKRYYEDNTLKSQLIYSADGKEADATLYHPNGFISSNGKYINQLKEGKWRYYSSAINGYLLCEENYTKNLRNGLSVRFYPDSTIAEKVNFTNDVRSGEWIQYYPDGTKCVKSAYLNGKVNGKFEVWFENGKLEFSGQYVNDLRDGKWLIYDDKGSIKYQIDYKLGNTEDRQMDIDEANYLDQLERNKGKIADPEKTGAFK